MSLSALVNHATDKTKFLSVQNYIDFCARYLEFSKTGLQARIVSQNENHYQFFQYGEEADFNITRPINTRLMYEFEEFTSKAATFLNTLQDLSEGRPPDVNQGPNVIRTIYTMQQAIGTALDALPSGRSNQARKINGDLFERLICTLITMLKVDCVAGTMQVPVYDKDGTELFKANYQHDLLIGKDDELKAIGSVKTSSKDRIDKIFMDKFLYSRLTETALPHIAIFLNDVQRKRGRQENQYGISATFLPGHFKAYTIKLNPLDGVYYCDIRPNMVSDAFLAQHIKTIDQFFFADLWTLISKQGKTLDDVVIEPGEASEQSTPEDQ